MWGFPAGSRRAGLIWAYSLSRRYCGGPGRGAGGVHWNAVRPKLRQATGSCRVRFDTSCEPAHAPSRPNVPFPTSPQIHRGRGLLYLLDVKNVAPKPALRNGIVIQRMLAPEGPTTLLTPRDRDGALDSEWYDQTLAGRPRAPRAGGPSVSTSWRRAGVDPARPGRSSRPTPAPAGTPHGAAVHGCRG